VNEIKRLGTRSNKMPCNVGPYSQWWKYQAHIASGGGSFVEGGGQWS
jgi:hypothetical protein